MLNPKENKNLMFQLNMGEGKSSVLIPILVSSIANTNKNCVARVIVLRSLLNTNYLSLVQKLGGLLNKRVYMFPCRRDINFSSCNLKTYKNLLQECQKLKSVILTLPEYILSFKLKGIEHCFEEKNESKDLIDIQEMYEANSRDILDESDEILSVNYQLIYSIGNKSIVSGKELRWEVSLV